MQFHCSNDTHWNTMTFCCCYNTIDGEMLGWYHHTTKTRRGKQKKQEKQQKHHWILLDIIWNGVPPVTHHGSDYDEILFQVKFFPGEATVCDCSKPQESVITCQNRNSHATLTVSSKIRGQTTCCANKCVTMIVLIQKMNCNCCRNTNIQSKLIIYKGKKILMSF